MIGASVAALGAVGGNGRPVILPASLHPAIGFARAHVATFATRLGSNGTWTESGADTARFTGTARRLLIEGQRSNLLADPRAIGGANWTLSGLLAASAVAGPDGGAASAARITEDTSSGLHLVGGPSITFTSGQSYTGHVLLKAGTRSIAQLLFYSGAFGLNAFANFDLGAGVIGAAGSAVTNHRMRGPYNGWWWCEFSATATATASAQSLGISPTTSAASGRGPFYAGTGGTLDAAYASVEAASFASTPILPLAGSPAASTRGGDIATAALSGLGIGGNGACTVLGSFMLPQAAPGSVTQALLAIDGGDGNNRWQIANSPGSADIAAQRVTGGTPLSTSSAGSFTPGTPFRIGATFDGAGRMALCVEGGAIKELTGGPTTGMTTLRAGCSVIGFNQLFGEIGRLRLLPFPLSDAALPGAVLAQPM